MKYTPPAYMLRYDDCVQEDGNKLFHIIKIKCLGYIFSIQYIICADNQALNVLIKAYIIGLDSIPYIYLVQRFLTFFFVAVNQNFIILE